MEVTMFEVMEMVAKHNVQMLSLLGEVALTLREGIPDRAGLTEERLEWYAEASDLILQFTSSCSETSKAYADIFQSVRVKMTAGALN